MTDYIVPHLRTQTELVDAVEARVRDSNNDRWTAAEVKTALNDALQKWSGRVSVPLIYTISGGWVAGQYQYTIPDYIPYDKFIPQRRIEVPYVGTDGDTRKFVWTDILGWNVEPDGSGGQSLRLEWNEGMVGAENTARLLWWTENGTLPTTAVTLNASIDAAATSLVLSSSVDVPRATYVKVDDEWIQYAGSSTDGNNTTLTNLVRGVNSTAVSHASGVTVHFGVAMPSLRLLDQLYNQMLANVYSYLLNESSSDVDRDRAKWNMRWRQQLADEFWRGWVPRSPVVKRTRRGAGHKLWGYTDKRRVRNP